MNPAIAKAAMICLSLAHVEVPLALPGPAIVRTYPPGFEQCPAILQRYVDDTKIDDEAAWAKAAEADKQSYDDAVAALGK